MYEERTSYRLIAESYFYFKKYFDGLQNNGDIKRESSVLFYRLLAGKKYLVPEGDIAITIWKTQPFTV